jgi:hypothetical protein
MANKVFAITAVEIEGGYEVRVAHTYDKKRATPSQTKKLANGFLSDLQSALGGKAVECGLVRDDDTRKRATTSIFVSNGER